MSVEFVDNSMQVKDAIRETAISFLYESAESLTSQVADNTRVDTGETKGRWEYVVDESELIATIGNPLENAIWEEFGTGEFAVNGDGRKGGWWYQSKKTGEWVHTFGKRPNRAFQSAYETLKNPIIERAKALFEKG